MEHGINTHLNHFISIEGINIESIKILVDVVEYIKVLQHIEGAFILCVQADESRTGQHQQICNKCSFHDAKIEKNVKMQK